MADAFQSGANIEIIVNPFEGQPPVAGRYAVFTEIGAGPTGRVYVADDQRKSGRRVAVKVLTPRMSADMDDPTGRKRFVLAARNAARLDHPSIVPVLAIDNVKGSGTDHVAIVYAYESWPTLAAVVRDQGPLEPDAARRIIDRVAEAVDYAHENDVLHLNLHPGNIFLGPDGAVRLADFAVRGALQGDVAEHNPQRGDWLPPEQQTGGEVSRASDVYALGLILQHCLTGEAPDPDSTEPLPGAFDLVVERATRKTSTERLPGMEAFRHALKSPASYRTPVPSGVFVAPSVSEPQALDLGSEPAVPLGLWIALGLGGTVLLLLCVFVIAAMWLSR